MNKKEKTAIKRLIKDALKEMKQKQIILLERGDFVSGDDIPLLKEMYSSISGLLEKEWSDKEEFVRYKNEQIFEPNESFFLSLFDTQEFIRLFDLYEFE